MVEHRSFDFDTGNKLAVAGTPVAGTYCKKALTANIGSMGAESTCLSDGKSCVAGLAERFRVKSEYLDGTTDLDVGLSN